MFQKSFKNYYQMIKCLGNQCIDTTLPTIIMHLHKNRVFIYFVKNVYINLELCSILQYKLKFFLILIENNQCMI